MLLPAAAMHALTPFSWKAAQSAALLAICIVIAVGGEERRGQQLRLVFVGGQNKKMHRKIQKEKMSGEHDNGMDREWKKNGRKRSRWLREEGRRRERERRGSRGEGRKRKFAGRSSEAQARADIIPKCRVPHQCCKQRSRPAHWPSAPWQTPRRRRAARRGRESQSNACFWGMGVLQERKK